MRLVVDMNASPAWCGYLQAHGYEAVHWSSVGHIEALDTSIMAYAREHDAVVLTGDLDLVICSLPAVMTAPAWC